MTYNELKEETEWSYCNDSRMTVEDLDNLTDEKILTRIREDVKENSSSWYIKMLTNVDTSLRTTVGDLLEALHKAGFPQEKIHVIDEKKARIELDGKLYMISSAQMGHSFLFDEEDVTHNLDFIHTPAEFVATYLVERYCSDDWIERDSLWRLGIYKKYLIWLKQLESFKDAIWSLNAEIHYAIIHQQEYKHFYNDYIKACITYYHHIHPDDTDNAIKKQAMSDYKEVISLYQEEFLTRQAEKEKTMIVVFKRNINLSQLSSLSYDECIEHLDYEGRYDAKDFCDFFQDTFFTYYQDEEYYIKVFVMPDDRRQAYLIKSSEEPILLSDGRIIQFDEYYPPYEELYCEPRLFIYKNRKDYDRHHEEGNYDYEQDDGEEIVHIEETPVDILNELVSLQKAMVMSIKEFETYFNTVEDQYFLAIQ